MLGLAQTKPRYMYILSFADDFRLFTKRNDAQAQVNLILKSSHSRATNCLRIKYLTKYGRKTIKFFWKNCASQFNSGINFEKILISGPPKAQNIAINFVIHYTSVWYRCTLPPYFKYLVLCLSWSNLRVYHYTSWYVIQ